MQRISLPGLVRNILLVPTLFSLFGCAGPLYTVAKLPSNPPAEMVAAAVGGLEVSAAAYSDERSIAHFDANLPLAGLIAVEVKITNRTSSQLSARSFRISLLTGTGSSLKPIAPKSALRRVMKYYGVRLYGKESYARTLESYESVAFQFEGDLQSSGERHGMVFFETKQPVTNMTGYKLLIDGGPAPIALQLN